MNPITVTEECKAISPTPYKAHYIQSDDENVYHFEVPGQIRFVNEGAMHKLFVLVTEGEEHF